MNVYIHNPGGGYINIENANLELLDAMILYLERQRREKFRVDRNLKGATYQMLQDILSGCCSHFNLSPEQVKRKGSARDAARVRDVYCLLSKRHAGASYRQIGSLINRESSTAYTAYKRARRKLEGLLVEPHLVEDITAIESKLFINKIKL